MHITFSTIMGASGTWFDLIGKKISSLSTISSGIASKRIEKNIALVRSKDTEEGGPGGRVIDAAEGSISQP